MTIPNLVERVYAEKAKKITRQPCHYNRASSIGSRCMRRLVYMRTHGDKAKLPDIGLFMIFQQGSLHERQSLRDLEDAGFQIIEQQVTLEWREFQLSGHVDCVVVIDDKPIPLDIKSMAPWIWEGVFKRGPGQYPWAEVREAFERKHWLSEYRGQLTLYMLLKGVDRGILLCVNKSTGAMAQVDLELDYEFGESLLRKATEINRHVAASTLPERIEFDPDVCPSCQFYIECLPSQQGQDPLAFVSDETLEHLLEEREALVVAGKEFDGLDKRAKGIIKAREEKKFVVGDFIVQKTGSDRVVVKIEKLSGQL